MTDEETSKIRKFIEVDTLGYLSLNGLLKSVPNEDNDYCTACFSGKYPTELPGYFTKSCLENATPNSHFIDALSLRYEK